MKTLFKTLVIVCIVVLFTACNRSDDNINTVTTISSISPNHGPKGTEVTLYGNGFGSDISTVTISINGVSANVVSVSNTEIEFIVPSKSYNGEVIVTIDDVEHIGPYFDYEISEVNVSTFAGSTSGNIDGNLQTAKFDTPFSMIFDSNGNMFVVDEDNSNIRKITPDGIVSTFAGSIEGFANGIGTIAKFKSPNGITIDADDNLYITDTGNHKIRKISPTGHVTTIAGSSIGDFDDIGENAKFKSPKGIAIDAEGNLYITDSGNHKIKRITPDNIVETIAGSEVGHLDGNGLNTKFTLPGQITLGSDNALYVVDTGADVGLHGVRKILLSGEVSTVVGNIEAGYVNGSIEEARFNTPQGITTDDYGNIYISDYRNNVIRRISKSGSVTTLAGSVFGLQDGVGEEAMFKTVLYMTIDSDNNLYVADGFNDRVRKITQE
ncbi:IPT/TIG domain-containing protein [Psychroserpens damuponensis]|uniref:IPT/TIG domain-containing protein n=1 Tax=Psychroserpens damuponensis TaxID=943936 RepID=UPI00058E8161|nr:IPT/TIG domain-containing protein [Psychroserpens damuponensis]